MQSLTHHVCHHSNVVVYAGHGQWWLSRALGPPKKLVEQEGGRHTRLHNSNEWLVHNTEVAFVEGYENTTPRAERARHVLAARAGRMPIVDALLAARKTSFYTRPDQQRDVRCAHTLNGRRMREKGTDNARRENAPSAAARCSVYELEALREPVGCGLQSGSGSR
jgi:hypothetical protein